MKPFKRAAIILGASLAIVGASAGLNTAIASAPSYRHCGYAAGASVSAKPSMGCQEADHIANRGMRTDGDDGVRFRVNGREWQCVTIARPDHGLHTLFGCFSPYAPASLDQPRYRALAVVTMYLDEQADLTSVPAPSPW